MKRRFFMQFLAGIGAGTLLTPIPWKLLDDASIWTQNWSWIPRLPHGEEAYVKLVSKSCPSASAMRVRLVNGEPVRCLPDATHPFGGGISALALAEAQLMRSPSRVKTPLKRNKEGKLEPISWSEAAELLASKLQEAGENSAFLCGDPYGSTTEVMSSLAAHLGSDKVFLMPSEDKIALKAMNLLGIEAQMGYDLEQSDFVLILGADVLESWGTSIRNRRIFSQKKKEGSARYIFAGSYRNQTATVVDEWIPTQAASDTSFLMYIAAELIRRGKLLEHPEFAEFAKLALRFPKADYLKRTAVSEERMDRLVDELLAAKNPLIITGSPGLSTSPVLVCFIVNALLGTINKPGGLQLIPIAKPLLTKASNRARIAEKSIISFFGFSDLPSVLVMHNANPAYALPGGEIRQAETFVDDQKASSIEIQAQRSVKEALRDIPFSVSFTSYLDETALLSNLVLPIPTGLEQEDDLYSPYGVGKASYAINRRVYSPKEDVRAAADVLFLTAKNLGYSLGYNSYSELLQAKAKHLGADPKELATGALWQGEAKVDGSPHFLQSALLEETLLTAPPSGFVMVLQQRLSLGTASTAIPPCNTTTIRGTDLYKHAMKIFINSHMAKSLNLDQDSLATVRMRSKSFDAYVQLDEGVGNNCVKVITGFGHTAFDAFSQNKGINIMEFLPAIAEVETGLYVLARTGVHIAAKTN